MKYKTCVRKIFWMLMFAGIFAGVFIVAASRVSLVKAARPAPPRNFRLFGMAPANQAPVAQLKKPSSGLVGLSVGLDGSASRDPDGQIVRYHFDFGDGTRLSTRDAVVAHAVSVHGV